MAVFHYVALPRSSWFRTNQTRSTTAFKGCHGKRSTCLFAISMLDKGKHNSRQENLKENNSLLSMKQNPRQSFRRSYKESGLGDGSHVPVQEVLEEVLSTKSFDRDNNLTEQFTECNKQGTLIGAISLITGTSIGSGILALPARTAPAGFIPSAVSMIICWGFLVLEALLLAELNAALLRQEDPSQPKKVTSAVISLRTMAEKTLGKWGGYVSTINYIFLSYTIMVAYISKSGEVLSCIVQIPASIAGQLFACIFGILVLVGGTKVTDKVNQLLTACLMGLFLFIVAATPLLRGWSGISHMDWDQVPQTVPVILFSLVYHDLIPVLCAYLGGDISRIKTSIIVGSMVPLAAFLVWDAAALGVAPISSGEDPLDSLLRGAYGMMVLYGIFPPAMAWALRESNDKLKSEECKPLTVPGGRFALAGIGLCASGVVLNQMFIDLAGVPFRSIVDNGLITEISSAISTVL